VTKEGVLPVWRPRCTVTMSSTWKELWPLKSYPARKVVVPSIQWHIQHHLLRGVLCRVTLHHHCLHLLWWPLATNPHIRNGWPFLP